MAKERFLEGLLGGGENYDTNLIRGLLGMAIGSQSGLTTGEALAGGLAGGVQQIDAGRKYQQDRELAGLKARVLKKQAEAPSYSHLKEAGGRIFDASKGKWVEGGPTFAGTGMDQQSMNLLLSGDPSSAEYAAAYNHLSAPKMMLDQQTGAVVTMQPNMSAFRKPMFRADATTAAAPPRQSPVAPTTASPPPATSSMQVPGGTVSRTGQQRPLLTKAEEAVDKAFGTEYATFATGGFADVQKNIKQLKEVRDRLTKRDDLTGPVVGNLPNAMRRVTNPSSIAAQEAVEEVVQRNLKLVLGAQFTEKEGEKLIARAYNPALEEGENKKRLDRLIGAIETAYEAKKRAAEYYETHGTLKGFKGKWNYTMSDIENAAGLTSGQPTVVDW